MARQKILLWISSAREKGGWEWIPPVMPWEQVEKKFKTKVPAWAKKIRGKLNLPRERFRVGEDGLFVWAVEIKK